MSGMLNETKLNSVPLKGLVQWAGGNNPEPPNGLRRTHRAREMKLPVSIRTFRSGPSYRRALEAGAIPSDETMPSVFTRLSRMDNGHEFNLLKPKVHRAYAKLDSSVIMTGAHGFYGSGSMGELCPTGVRRVGLIPDRGSLGIDLSWRTTAQELQEYGTEQLNRTAPLQSEANLLVSIGELLIEGLPSVIGKQIFTSGPGRNARIKAAGSEYLNLVFGYQPIVSDIVRVYDTMMRVDDIVDQWIRDNQRQVRRRRRSPRANLGEDLSVDIEERRMRISYDSSGLTRAGESRMTSSGGTPGTLYDSVYRRTGIEALSTMFSFSSAYSYDLSKLRAVTPGVAISRNSKPLRDALKLHALGLSPESFSPAMVWDLLPFSWMVDWFTNVGDVLSTFQQFQSAGLQLNYGYATSTQTYRVRWDSSLTTRLRATGDTVYSGHFGQFYEVKSVQRIRATPYGFGVSFDGLNNKQKGILAALASQALPTP